MSQLASGELHPICGASAFISFSVLAWRIPTDRGTWWATVHGVGAQRVMTERLTLSSLEQSSLAEIWIYLFPSPPQ